MSGPFIPLHVECTGELRVAAPLQQAFSFFTPQGERRWVPGWNPEYLHPREGLDGEGAVFRTSADGEETLWLIARLDAQHGAADYVRVTPGSRIGTVSIRCEAAGPSTVIHVIYQLTGLDERGNRELEAFRSGFSGMLHDWEVAVSAALHP